MQALLPKALFYIPPRLVLHSRNSKENCRRRPKLFTQHLCTQELHISSLSEGRPSRWAQSPFLLRTVWLVEKQCLKFDTLLCTSTSDKQKIGLFPVHMRALQIWESCTAKVIWYQIWSISLSGSILHVGFISLPGLAKCVLSFSAWHSQVAHFSPPHWNWVFLE